MLRLNHQRNSRLLLQAGAVMNVYEVSISYKTYIAADSPDKAKARALQNNHELYPNDWRTQIATNLLRPKDLQDLPNGWADGYPFHGDFEKTIREIVEENSDGR